MTTIITDEEQNMTKPDKFYCSGENLRSAQVSEAKDHLRGKSEIVECARELFGDGKVQDVPGAVEGPSATPNTKGNGSGRSQA